MATNAEGKRDERHLLAMAEFFRERFPAALGQAVLDVALKVPKAGQVYERIGECIIDKVRGRQ